MVQTKQQASEIERCPWPGNNLKMIEYHDAEWGRPCFNDKKLYEFFLLDTFQAGLSWAIILSKRNNFKKAFSNFTIAKVAAYNRQEQNQLLRNSGIIRNRLKIDAAIANASMILDIQREYGSFAKYLWSFTQPHGAGAGFTRYKSIQHHYKRLQDIPTTSKEAEAMSKDMRAKGFRFVGPTTLYAFMQGIGMVNDHLVSCFAYKEAKKAVFRRS